jgi:hypothetical protein
MDEGKLLRRYCAFELDQWDLWKTQTSYGTAFIDVMRVPRERSSPDAYVSLDTDQIGRTDAAPHRRTRAIPNQINDLFVCRMVITPAPALSGTRALPL